jgi:hypothetical protein
MQKVEVFIGVVITRDDLSEDRYDETGVLEGGSDAAKLVAAVGMRTLKKILDRIRGKKS